MIVFRNAGMMGIARPACATREALATIPVPAHATSAATRAEPQLAAGNAPESIGSPRVLRDTRRRKHVVRAQRRAAPFHARGQAAPMGRLLSRQEQRQDGLPAGDSVVADAVAGRSAGGRRKGSSDTVCGHLCLWAKVSAG
jgi:hypothetical protein